MIKAYITAFLLTPILVIVSFLYLAPRLAGMCIVSSPAIVISMFLWQTVKADPKKRRLHLLLGFITVATIWTITVTTLRSIVSKRFTAHSTVCVAPLLAAIDRADTAVVKNGEFPDLVPEEEIATITDKDTVRELIHALELTECNPRQYACGCSGHPWVMFKQGPRGISTLRFHHGRIVEWSSSRNVHRAGMTSNSMVQVQAWFDAQNIPTPPGGGLIIQPEEPSTNRISLPTTH